MRLFRQVLDFVVGLWGKFEEAHRLMKINKALPYRIIDVNVIDRNLSLHCSGTQAVIKISFAEAMADPAIIKGLPSLQSCWLGYYFARFQSDALLKRDRKGGVLGFKPQYIRSRFKIVSFQNGTGILTYHDIKLDFTYSEKITIVAQDEFIINNIDTTQACYIGMQAGYQVNKYGIGILKKSVYPVLKVIK